MSRPYPWRTKPYAHQVKAIKQAVRHIKAGHAGIALLMEPRTGKTKTTIDTLSILHMKFGLRKIVVVAPNRVLGNWVQEFAMHCPFTVQTIIWDKDARKRPLPSQVAPYDLQVILVNYEAFSTPGRRLPSGKRSQTTGRFKHRKLLRSWMGGDDVACVLDESHKIKSASGKASNMIVSMRDDFRYRFLLTGTPVTKASRAHDIYMQWQFLNPKRFADWPTLEDFKNNTGRWLDTNGYPQWVREREDGMEKLKRRVHADSFAIKREECFDLPPREERVIPVPLGPSGKHYDEMAQTMVTQLENGDIAEASIPLVVTLRLLQITSGFVGIREPHPTNPDKMVSRAERLGFEKLQVLTELLTEETLEREEKVVIAARFQADLDAIQEACDSVGLTRWSVRGGMTRQDTDEAITAFRRHDGPGAMIIQPAAAGLGIDLSTAAHMIWYSLTSSWVDYSQACDRIALSRTSTTFTYLLAPDTVDTLLYDALKSDGDVAKMILKRPDLILRSPHR